MVDNPVFSTICGAVEVREMIKPYVNSIEGSSSWERNLV